MWQINTQKSWQTLKRQHSHGKFSGRLLNVSWCKHRFSHFPPQNSHRSRLCLLVWVDICGLDTVGHFYLHYLIYHPMKQLLVFEGLFLFCKMNLKLAYLYLGNFSSKGVRGSTTKSSAPDPSKCLCFVVHVHRKEQGPKCIIPMVF